MLKEKKKDKNETKTRSVGHNYKNKPKDAVNLD